MLAGWVEANFTVNNMHVGAECCRQPQNLTFSKTKGPNQATYALITIKFVLNRTQNFWIKPKLLTGFNSTLD